MAGMLIQPQGYARALRDHPDLTGAVDIWMPGLSARGLLNGISSTTPFQGSVKATPSGIGFNSTGAGLRMPAAGLTSTPVAWMIIAHRTAATVNCSVVRKDGCVTPLQEWDGQARCVVFNSGGGYDTSVNYGAATQFADKVTAFCGVMSSTESLIFYDQTMGFNLNKPTSGPSNTNPLCIGANESGGETSTNYTVLMLVMWAGTVPTSVRLRALAAAPWQLFDDPDSHDAELAATVAAYTLSGASAAFTVSNQLATLVASRRLAAAVAGYALAATAAVMTAARRLLASTGTFTTSGAPGRLAAARRLPAAAGAVNVSGSAAALLAARKLSGQPGIFSATGGAATFTYTPLPGGVGPTYTLAGGSGAFLVAPSAARLLAGRRLPAAGGGFTAATSQARLLVARRLSVAPGAFSAAAAPARLLVARRIAASSIALTFTPAPARLRTARWMQAAPGSFAVLGSAATFAYSGGRGESIDASLVPASRTVVFGGGTRVVVFGGGTRVVVFDVPSIEKELSVANAAKPYFKDGKWFVDKDPDEISYYVADVTQELTDRATTITSVEVIVGGVTLIEGPAIQGSVIVVKLRDMDVSDHAGNFWTARVTCANTERFDRTTWLNRVDN